MPTYKKILNRTRGELLLEQARWCANFAGKLRGFTFHRQISPQEGLVLVERTDSRLNSSIHMLFVPFALGVIWVNQAGRVVDKVVAQPWRLSYLPQVPACYVIELHPDRLSQVEIGNEIEFI